MGPTLCFLFCLTGATPPPVTVTGCPRVVAHDRAWQRRAAAGLAKAPPEVQAIGQEWLSLRDQSNTCATAGRKN